MAELSLQKGFFKLDSHLILCDDDIFKDWQLIMNRYAKGSLPNTKGEVTNFNYGLAKKTTLKGGQLQQAPGTVTLGPTIFRCIAGLLPDEVRILQKDILKGRIVLKKGKKAVDLVDMEEMTKKMKVNRVLKEEVVAYFSSFTLQKLDWTNVCNTYHIGDEEYGKLYSWAQDWAKDKLNKTKVTPSLPKSITSFLHYLYQKSNGQRRMGHELPWKIHLVEKNKVYGFCSELEQVPFSLAILDATLENKDGSLFLEESFEDVVKGLDALNSDPEYILLSFVDFIHIGNLVQAVAKVATKYHHEIGTIDLQNKKSWMGGCASLAVVVIYISKMDHFDTLSNLHERKVFISWSASSSNLECTEKKKSLHNSVIDRGFLSSLIQGLCPEHRFVIDVFSGGNVLIESLISHRKCLALTTNPNEVEFLDSTCSRLVEEDKSVSQWFSFFTKSIEHEHQCKKKHEALEKLRIETQTSDSEDEVDEADNQEDKEDKHTIKDIDNKDKDDVDQGAQHEKSGIHFDIIGKIFMSVQTFLTCYHFDFQNFL